MTNTQTTDFCANGWELYNKMMADAINKATAKYPNGLPSHSFLSVYVKASDTNAVGQVKLELMTNEPPKGFDLRAFRFITPDMPIDTWHKAKDKVMWAVGRKLIPQALWAAMLQQTINTCLPHFDTHTAKNPEQGFSYAITTALDSNQITEQDAAVLLREKRAVIRSVLAANQSDVWEVASLHEMFKLLGLASAPADCRKFLEDWTANAVALVVKANQ